ncbi:MAG: M15 family metallopeptidase, partial [Clostridia bacterium]|nr:M15 family metallopeptidase [Clostridia bacterium]
MSNKKQNRRDIINNFLSAAKSLFNTCLRFIRSKNGIITCAVILAALLVSLLIGALFSSNGDPKVSETASVSEEVTTEATESETEAVTTEVPDLEPEIPSGTADTTANTEKRLTLSDMEIPDTSWAYFIVNRSNPVPAGLENEIEFKAVRSYGTNYYLDARAADFAECMINDAEDDGVTLIICSAYRSYERQTSNFENRLKSYASSKYSFANAYALTAGYIAVPGTSEHHTGLAIDFITPGYMYLDDGFEDTDAYKWLAENCYKYGFIMRYPSEKSELTGINYEPWHFRFIGFEHAEKIHNSGLCLEEYMELDKETNPEITINPLEPLAIPAEPAWYDLYLNPPVPVDSETDSESVSDDTLSGDSSSEDSSDDTLSGDSSSEDSSDDTLGGDSSSEDSSDDTLGGDSSSEDSSVDTL